MCIPSNITALAAETTATETQQATYTAAISPAEHGTIVFTGDTGDSRQFNKNDKVDVTLKPDKGYKVSQFKVTNTDTGKVLAQENTKNNRFTFYMPEKNVTISANFDVEESAIEMPEDAGDNSGAEEEDGSDDEDGEPRPAEADGTTEEASLTSDIITLNLDEETAEDAAEITKETVEATDGLEAKDMEDPVLVSEYDENGLAQTGHMATLMYTIADKEVLKPAPEGQKPLRYLFDHNIEAFYTTIYQDMPIYASKDNNDYYISFVDISKISNLGDCIDYTINDTNTSDPEYLGDIIQYDQETGILYIPKTFYFTESGEETDKQFNIQLLIASDVCDYDTGRARVTIENHDSSIDVVAEEQTIDTELFDVTVDIPIATKATAANLLLDNISIYLNDSKVPKDYAEDQIAYDPETGVLTIEQSGLSLYSIRVVVEDKTLAEKVTSLFTEPVYAKVKADDMAALPLTLETLKDQTIKCKVGEETKTIRVIDMLTEGSLYSYEGFVCYEPNWVMTKANQAGKKFSKKFFYSLVAGIGSSAPYLYWGEQDAISNALRDKDKNYVYDGADITKGGKANGSSDSGSVDYKKGWCNFVIQCPGNKTMTLEHIKEGNYKKTPAYTDSKVPVGQVKKKIKLTGNATEWLRDKKKTTKAYNIQINSYTPTSKSDGSSIGGSKLDLRVTKTGTKNSKLTWKRSDGDNWGEKGAHSIDINGNVSITINGTKRSMNARNLLALRCTDGGTHGTQEIGESADTYVRILKVDRKKKYIILGMTVDEKYGTQDGHGIYKVKYTDESKENYSVKIENKTIKDAEYLKGNENYTVDGVQYCLYKDEDCTKPVLIDADGDEDDKDNWCILTIQADEDDNTVGSAQRDDIPATGTYYLKELPTTQTDSLGVNWNTKVYTVKVEESNTKDNPAVVSLAAEEDWDPHPAFLPGMDISKLTNASIPDPATATFALEQNIDGENWTKVADIKVTGNQDPVWTEYTKSNGDKFLHTWLDNASYRLYETKQEGPISGCGRLVVNGKDYPMPTAAAPFDFLVAERPESSTSSVKVSKAVVKGKVVESLAFIAYDSYKYYGFHFAKTDLYYGSTPEGNATDLKATYELYAGVGEGGTHCTVNPQPMVCAGKNDVGSFRRRKVIEKA